MSATVYNLQCFIDEYNKNLLPTNQVPSWDALLAYARDVSRSLYDEHERPDSFGLRLSQIGKPPIIQGLQLLGWSSTELARNGKLRHGTFHVGNEFEARLKYLLRLYGHLFDLTIAEEEVEVRFDGIKGHADMVLNSDLLVEIKTMGQGPFMQASRVGINDDLGYATQLSTYSSALELPAVWVVEDKTTTAMKLITLSDEEVKATAGRASAIIDGLKTVEKVAKERGTLAGFTLLMERFSAPPPRAYRNKLYLQRSVAWSPFRHVLYDIILDDDSKELFNGYLEPDDVWKALKEDREAGYFAFTDPTTRG